jgi:hypothetical protein
MVESIIDKHQTMSRRAFVEETCVFYDSSDAIVGRALAYASLTPPFLVIMYCTLGLVVRDTLVSAPRMLACGT